MNLQVINTPMNVSYCRFCSLKYSLYGYLVQDMEDRIKHIGKICILPKNLLLIHVIKSTK